MVTGAEVSMVERLRLLSSSYGWTTQIHATAHQRETEEILLSLGRNDAHIARSDASVDASVMGIPTTTHLLEKKDVAEIFATFDKALAEHSPSSTLLFLNARDTIAVSYAQQRRYPTVYFLSEDFFPRPRSPAGRATGTRALYAGASNLVVPSRFLAERVEQAWGTRPKVFLDVTSPKSVPAGLLNPRRYVSLMHPYEHKGVDVFIDLARALPQLPFLCVTGFGDSFKSRLPILRGIPNVSIRPFAGDISPILAETLMVLVPSLCRDVYPRVILESLSAGVPVVASDIGGCREAGGDTVRYVPIEIHGEQALGTTSTLDWMRTMRELLTATNYEELQDHAKARYASYRKELHEDMNTFIKWCDDIIQSHNEV
jgi:glycosyltransferase involved in cell wall biosynthesis